MTWKPSQMPDQSGRTIVITGANGGIGAHTTRALADRGATVIMACRNTMAAQSVANSMQGDVRVAALDLADLSSIREFADKTGPIDVLINNAGLMNIPFSRTKDGFETQWGVNHLGHFALTGLLLDRIRDRVVTLASIAHRHTPTLRVDDLNYQNRRYQRNVAYGQAKLSNLMFARELQHRLAAAGSTVRSYGVHPGVAATDLFTRTETPLDWVSKPFVAIFGHSPRKAAESSLFAATETDADPEVYWGPRQLGGMRGPVRACGSSKLSQDRDLQRRLWEESEKLTDVHYRF
ncbi:oxidoreductase [Nocardia stercoris]|uniref:SDR family NAD(P)-dependent oxidoreductase n=1 Tax=Nocardia stercoris TaxID=2483361 RepID=A0A3M2L5T1_9NOCA|nr:oxidoreductase [Nocardia stercoris]RMI32971.1 SDR family NAD(P)-dependent oxidoreductase [Nocardia stercoris]